MIAVVIIVMCHILFHMVISNKSEHFTDGKKPLQMPGRIMKWAGGPLQLMKYRCTEVTASIELYLSFVIAMASESTLLNTLAIPQT